MLFFGRREFEKLDEVARLFLASFVSLTLQLRRPFWVAESVRGLSSMVYNASFIKKVMFFKADWEKKVPRFLWDIKKESKFNIPEKDALKECVIFFFLPCHSQFILLLFVF